MIDMSRALMVNEAATDLWDEARQDATSVQYNTVEDMLDRALDCLERDDWTGMWMWAGHALGFIREHVTPPPVAA